MKVSKFYIFASFVFMFAFSSIRVYADVVHKVESGDTYYSIARKYGINVSKLYSANNITEKDTLKTGQKLIIPTDGNSSSAEKSVLKYDIYEVQKDDTFYRIAKNNSITVDELLEVNNFTTKEVLKVGKKIKIPRKDFSNSSLNEPKKETSIRKFDTYTVQKGDTLYRIAKVNAITVNELKNLNGLDSKSELKIGQKLKIPVTIVDTANSNLPSLPDDPRKYSNKKGDPKLSWPVKNPVITYMTGKISGVQLCCQKNENVTAIRAGTVMYVGNYRGYGQVVFVQTKTGHIYVYSGLGTIKVQKGDYLVFGDVLGTAGTDSIKGTNQMCLMVFQKSSPIDPAKAPRG